MTVRNGLASLDLLWPDPEVSNPAVVKNRAEAAFRLDFESRLSVEEMIPIGICVSGANLEESLRLPRRKGRAGCYILVKRRGPLRVLAAATVEQIAWAVGWLTIPLDSEPLDDCGASAAVPQVKVNCAYILRHVSGGEVDDGECGRFHLFLVGGDELLHRTAVVDGDDEGNNRDEDRRSSNDEIEPGNPGVMCMRVRFVFDHWMEQK